jgi:hypothetical protein
MKALRDNLLNQGLFSKVCRALARGLFVGRPAVRSCSRTGRREPLGRLVAEGPFLFLNAFLINLPKFDI